MKIQNDNKKAQRHDNRLQILIANYKQLPAINAGTGKESDSKRLFYFYIFAVLNKVVSYS